VVCRRDLTVVRIYNGAQGEVNKFNPRRDFYIEQKFIHPLYGQQRRESVSVFFVN
jgi:hypothetical protein